MSAQGKTDSHSKLKPYFDYLMEVIPAQGANVVFSPPYLDAWGLGMKASFRAKQIIPLNLNTNKLPNWESVWA